MRAIPGITPLRAFAAALVLLSHVAFWSGAASVDGVGRLLARGDAGVAVFFALTAFLLLRPASHPDAAWPPRRYAVKRFARIAPAYWAALLGVVVIAPATAGGLGGAQKVLAHVFLLQGYTQHPYQSFTQTWSLTTEVTFYLLVPLLGRAWRSGAASPRKVARVLALVTVCGVVIQTWSATRMDPAFGALTTSVLGHAAWFAAGLGVLLARSHGWAQRLSPGWSLGMAASAYVLATTPLGGPVGLTHPTLFTAAGKEVLYTIFAAALVHAASAPLSGRWTAILEAPAAQTAGEVSYGVFLWHVLVIQVLFLSIGLPLFHAPFLLVLIPTVILSAGLAWISWRVIEQPAIARAHQRKPARTS